MMTKKTRTSLESESRVGFRIHSNGEVEMLTEAETLALILRAFREGMRRAGWSRLAPTFH
ncbi:hypothetical protein ACVIWV_002785 [Bradyrhizobium diazoefficiens]|jgi:hypothetical protein|uniref:Uncharacterized protein n=2 Tax=Bradyrhizobium diazoefficiens TaxID=1355477 RepID=A0A810ASG8_9BRAD|nr:MULTISPECIES: hypothetical protein [Bradyrhizobium]AND90432.1 hypothetical protein AAV28_23570 [Bradyrhizobium diazoefficiens USDA 110]MDA9536996.1 hypothetical protein [Bradyrhizobium sp. CCBAU 21362]MBR0864703.1 hypothetical protein [Bradyrhizobium diazoefficiens]MBR0889234.1 hypothetical protein [Bradyrhizobium diazoefficiens]MDA9389305.1 hypothetical protein [Bradyrhizobium sp. CCBAU 45394]